MQRKAKLVKCASTIFALLIMGITTFAGGLLVTRASARLRLDNIPTCQLVMDTEEDTVLVVFTNNGISAELQDLLYGVNGTQKYGLQCENPQTPPPMVSPPMATPCIETSVTTCVVGGISTEPEPEPEPKPKSESEPKSAVTIKCRLCAPERPVCLLDNTSIRYDNDINIKWTCKLYIPEQPDTV